MTTEKKAPRQFWITDNTDNSGYSVDTKFNQYKHFGSCNVFHVIEYSAYKELEEKYNSAKFAAEKLSEKLVDMNLYLQGADLQNKFSGPMLQACNKQIKSLEAKLEMAKAHFIKINSGLDYHRENLRTMAHHDLQHVILNMKKEACEAIAKLEGE